MLSLVQASEIQLATRKDRFISRGKTTISFPTPFGGIVNTPISPSNLGSRMVAASLIFSRYRFVKLLFRIVNQSVSSNLIVGLLDDASTSLGDLPTTFNDVAQLRCSTLVYFGLTVPTEFEWKPIDPLKWYYVDSESTGSADPRFTTPLTLCQFSSASSPLLYEVHYTIEFEGASDNS